MTPPPIQQQITFLYCKDLSHSARFYEEVMGFQLWLDQGSCRIYHITGEAYLGICQPSKTSKGSLAVEAHTNVIFTLVTDAVDTWYEYLRAKDVHFDKAPEYNPRYAIYHCFLRDPDGYLIEIQHFVSTSE